MHIFVFFLGKSLSTDNSSTMGGKKKVSTHQPRVKQNYKPSSSDKATRFLVERTGGLGGPFAHIFDAKLQGVVLDSDNSQTDSCQGKLTGFVPILHDPIASGLDPHLLNIFKRLGKRDSVTKQKALREFCELLKSECISVSTSSILAVLPYWPRIYHRLSFDFDRKVRELAQITMHVLALRVGKDLDPYIKQVVPVWTFSKVDTYESAALFATKGLCDLFPGQKLVDIHCLCAKQLLDMVENQLSELTRKRDTKVESIVSSKHSSSVANDDTVGYASAELSFYSVNLSSILRFLASFVGNLIHLSSDHKQLIRLKTLLLPNGIWEKVAHCLKTMGSGRHDNCFDQTHGALSSGYISLYKLCSVLCCDPTWCQWMKETSDGRTLGEYISNLTVGSLGVIDVSPGKVDTTNSIEVHTSLELGSSVYSALWNSALACLTGLSGGFVWSIVNWYPDFVTRLGNLLAYSEKYQTKQAYAHLLCLVNEFPLDYSNLKNHDLETLHKLFIDSTLLGLHRSLGFLPVSHSSHSETRSCLSDDPDLSIVITTGTLECVRYLIDRLLTPIEDENRNEFLLAKKLYSNVLIRLLSDCLITHERVDASPQLVCSRPPLSRQSYLNGVFSQTAKFCNNIAQSNHHLKMKLYNELKNTLFKWITLEESDQFITPIFDVNRVNRMFIGIVDPLRLISFIDHLAESSGQIVNGNIPNNSKASQIVDKLHQRDISVIVHEDWCVNLFCRIGDVLLRNMQDTFSKNSPNNSFHILLFLCVYGHLPPKSFSAPCILRQAFSSLLSKLPREVHAFCWSRPVIHGLAKLWVLSSENIDSELEIPTNSSTCLIFTNDILPLLMQSLHSLKNMFDSSDLCATLLSNRISNTLCFWAKVWFDKVFSGDETSPSTVVYSFMNNLHSLIINCLHHMPNNSSNDSSLGTTISIQLVATLSECLKERYTNLFCNYPNGNSNNASELRIIGSLLIHLLHNINNNNVFSSSCLDFLYLLLTKILFCLYSVSTFIKIKKSSDALSSSKSLVDGHSSPDIVLASLVNEDNDHHTYEKDEGNDDVLFSISNLINRSELIILERLNLEDSLDRCDESFFNQFSNLLFMNTVSSKFITPSFCCFALRIYSTVRDKKNSSSFISYFSVLWLKYLVRHVKLVLEAVVQKYPLPGAYFISRHLLQDHGICPLSVLPSFGQLIRLHQLGLLLRLHLQFTPCDNSIGSTQYLLCLGFIRVWISSFTEPWDLCIDIGWPLQQTDVNLLKVNNSFELLEPIMSGFRKSGLLLAKSLGLFWFEFTTNCPFSRLLSLSSSNVLGTITHLDSPTYHILNLTINILLLNRVRTMHPNLWPRDVKLAASCTDDDNQNLTWTELYLTPNPSTEIIYSDIMRFNKCIELYLPAGVIRRCLSRQRLFSQLKSFSSSMKEYDLTNLSDQRLKIHAYITELVSALVSVRATAPIYLTTFSSIILEDYRIWLASLTDSAIGDKNMCLESPEIFNICASTMSYLECLLLLWQPWQWSATESEKSPISVRLGLVYLSMRMRHLRPSLSIQQWDFILCLTMSWVFSVVQYFYDSPNSGAEKTIYDILATRAFRMAAALGAIFSERYSYLPLTDCIIVKEASASKRLMHSNCMDENDNEFEDEPVNEIFDEEEQAKIYDVQFNTNNQPQDALLESLNMESEELETDVSQMDIEDGGLDDEEYMYNVFARGVPIIPRRGEAPLSVRSDWGSVFAPEHYCTLLRLILKSCIPLEHDKPRTFLNTDIYIQALCAAFATCPANHLITAFSNQSSLIFEYLSDFQLKTDQPCLKCQLFPSKSASVNDFTVGFRASLNMACKLIVYSPHQSGQLLGYILLNRLFGTRVLQNKNKTSISIANYVIRRMPISWMSALSGLLPTPVENYLQSELAADHWGRGNSSLSYLIEFSTSGWTVDCQSHQALLSYLLAWDSLLSLMTCAGPQSRASIQSALLSSSATIFDRFMLIIGLLLPPSGNLEECINTVSRLEPDERLLLPNSTSRMYLTAALTAFCSRRHNKRPTNLATLVSSGDDSELWDAFSPDDTLLRIPGHRVAGDINHLAVRLFRRFLSEAPALIRSWHTQLTSSSLSQNISSQTSPLARHRPGRLRQLASTINKIVSNYFSSSLARDEVVLVQYRSYLRLLSKGQTSSNGLFSLLKSPPEVGTVRIKSRPLSREVSIFCISAHILTIHVRLKAYVLCCRLYQNIKSYSK
ncbi:E3 ubiquitin-protein ligase listerin isoform 5 [Schistosoma japonicum]|uniref:E3 ubiquitin-protein ligase listerin isoform 5 n=2 Tax=Schistosoma japonicum TaxID=6182 RepID=A0A4Z2CP43_SCHJA|nr:E3 ubiquitin-protein ligase [Schistosoma japonicum]KAH8865210.1 E3 ubiquitin-protein ligase [Schistosoma japonicum]KAH8865217.1 E3 ubiquitin-protein ligase [Schistosoma japonicum]KAH8865218.1 E3 ubiquitin-protein ligase [Schistosoma japonicum]KAH8865224.1 E3 ubiquitin-protein ligase [Schistosoma japonicum]